MSRNCKGRLSFVFKLVVAVCLTIFNALNVCGATIPLKGQTQGTSIGDGISTGFKVHHRQKRSSLDLAAICLRVRAYHGFHDWYLSPSYGCWCGLGQSGPGPALDSIDACCKAHDLCWQNLDENEGCGSGVFARYTYSINNGQVTCHSPNWLTSLYFSKCGRKFCKCDKALAECTVAAGALSTKYSFYRLRNPGKCDA